MDHRLFHSAVLCMFTIFKLSLGIDTLSANQTLADGDVLISPSQIFELGFLNPDSSTTRFLGIWYKSTPDVVVWIANRENPIIGLNGVLNLAKNGSLVLTSAQGALVWFSNSSMAASSPVLHLLDTGNLVVVENSTYIWQSFDYPGNTRLPGMKMVDDVDAILDKHLTSWRSPDDPSMGDYVYRIENHGLSHMSIFMGNVKKYRTGPFNGRYFTGLLLAYTPAFEAETYYNNGRLVFLSDSYNSSVYVRVILDYSGSLRGYIMNEQRDGWSLAFHLPSDPCDSHGWCGPNTMCTPYKTPVCDCLKGFMPKSVKEWSVYVWTSGCSRILPLDCQKEDGLKRVKFPDTLSFRREDSMTMDECREECLKNCNCTAFADPYFDQ